MIGHGLKHLGFKPNIDFVCQDDGEGPYIAEWLSETPQPAMEDILAAAAAGELAYARNSAVAAIMDATGSARVKYAINTDHQSTIYDVKSQEADAYVMAGRPEDASAYPVLVASAQANNRTVSLHADIVRAKRDVWVAIAAESERLRETGLNAIKDAQTYEAILAAKAEYVALLEAL